MKKIIGIIKEEDGENIVKDLRSGKNITNIFRKDMIDLAAESNQALEFNEETNQVSRQKKQLMFLKQILKMMIQY